MQLNEFSKKVKSALNLIIVFMFLFVPIKSIAKDKNQGIDFSFDDWEMVCDNTLTCRAAGYTKNEMIDGDSAMVMLIRKGGPDTKIANFVLLTNNDPQADTDRNPTPEIVINNTSYGPLSKGEGVSWEMTETQVGAFLDALSNKGIITFRNKFGRYSFSSKGSNAVLLKMDAFQGRVGTKGAIIDKGNKDDSEVPLPKSVPIVKKSTVIDVNGKRIAPDKLRLFKKYLLPTILNQQGGDCTEELDHENWFEARLNNKNTLIYTSCVTGEYNQVNSWYVVTSDFKKIIQQVGGENDEYHDGVIQGEFLGNSVGSSETTSKFIWDGSRFIDAYEDYRGQCSGYVDFPLCRMPSLITRQ